MAATGPFERITFEPGKMGGRACIRGMRVTVATIVGLVAEGGTTGAILAAYPDLEPEDIRQARACNGLVVAWPALVNIASTLPDQITAGTAQPAEKFAEIPEIRPVGSKCRHFLYRPQNGQPASLSRSSRPAPPLPPFGLPLPTTRPSPPLAPICGHGVPGSHGPSEGIVNHQKVTFRLRPLRPPESSPWPRCAR